MLWAQVEILKLCTLGSLDVVPGESSTLTLFLRVMDTFDDDDDDVGFSISRPYLPTVLYDQPDHRPYLDLQRLALMAI